MKDWKQLVRGSGESATNDVATITDCIDQDDTYHVEMGGDSGALVLHARTQRGVDGLLQEFGVENAGWRGLGEVQA